MTEVTKQDEVLEQEKQSEELTFEDIENLSKLVHSEAIKKDLANSVEEIKEKADSFRACLKGVDADKEFIDKKLEEYTVDQLETLLKNNDFVESFFVNPDTGEKLEMTIKFDSKQREMEFKRGLLAYFKSSQEAYIQIDKQFEELDKATAELNVGLSEACNALSDNVLTYVSAMTDKANEVTDEKVKAKMLRTLKYIKAGYDMSIFSEMLDEYPSVAKKVAAELTHEPTIQRIGKQYASKLKANKVKLSLVAFASDIESGKKSFEEIMLIREEQYIVPDLFVFSLIRFFAMANWSDPDIRKAHASVSLVIKKLLANEFIDEVKKDIIDAIVTYIAKFEVN